MFSKYVLLLAILATVSNGDEPYSYCLKNYSVLERAVLEGDRYDIIKAFYPPENSLPSVYVKVTYLSTEDVNIKERWLWTSVPIYLIQPPSVFQFTSLLFSHHSISNRTRELTIHLPPACYNTSALSCHDSSTNRTYLNNQYLDVLTNEIYLFARYDGRNERITLEDNMPSTSMRLDNNCANIDKKSFYLFNTFCFIGLPLLIYLPFSFIISTVRPKLRSILTPSLSKNGVNQNLAALVLTGLAFSIYVLICDILALVYSLNKHELEILYEYEDANIQQYTTITIWIIFIFDVTAFIISTLNIFILFFLQTKQCNKKALHHCLRITCCMCACKFVKDANREDYEPIYHEWSENNQTLREQAKSLQRQERWILQKRQKKRQQQPTESWLQEWKNELDQQEDQLIQWDNHIKQQRHSLPNERDLEKWEEELEQWKNDLQQWDDELSSNFEPNPNEQEQQEELWQEQLKQRQKQLKQKQNKLQDEENKLHEKLNKRLLAESKVWLLLVSFLAPLVCIGTHGGFVVMAWASDPDEANSLAVVFTLSFFYYFIGFRQFYIRISSFSCLKLKNIQTAAERQTQSAGFLESIHGVSTELEEYHHNLREINLSALICELLFLPFFMGIQALIFFSYYYLPAPISSIPLNIMNLLQLVLFFGTGLITYKLFTFSAPIEEIILDKFVKAYKPQANSSKDIAERVGETLGNALKKIVDGEQRPNAYFERSIELSTPT